MLTKSLLKDGLVVELRNNNRYLVHGDNLIRSNRYTPLELYDNELQFTQDAPAYDIMKIYKSSAKTLEHLFEDKCLTLIAERTTTAFSTYQEIVDALLEVITRHCL